MRQIPKAGPGVGLAMARDPYRFIGETCERLGTDVFEALLPIGRTICVRGPHAAEAICDEEHFRRAGAAPGALQKTLFGKGGVQGLDGDAHRARKAMFMALMDRDGMERLTSLSDEWWTAYARRWSGREIELYPQVRELLTRVACEWAGVPLAEDDAPYRTRQLTALFDHAGKRGPRHLWSRLQRKLADRWIEQLIEDARHRNVTDGTALEVFAKERSLDARTAAVEVLNVVRPTVAVAVYVVWMAHARYRHPGSDDAADNFINEVRRFYPFFPSVIAKVRSEAELSGFRLPEGARVMLDLHGTNNDPRIWPQPQRFDPSRFRDREAGIFDLIPQGPGDHFLNHRCAGEWATIALMRSALAALQRVDHSVVDHGGDVNFARLPALPERPLRIAVH